MISVGSRDGRNGVELSFGREEMEETELEEGEAFYNHNDDGDSAIDPDALSYIDEKLQHVLGHFQKDFEGGVSAENLGSKFGGYGSFLPAYQRSPSWSCPRTPAEGGRQNSFSSSSASLSARPAITSSNAMPVLRPPSGNDLVNQEVSILSNHGGELTSKFELQKSTNLADQKALKFRIKVGTENLSTHKNAEIYSGLGLDVSPSSSLDDSPTNSEGLYHDLHDMPHESPTSILKVMTSVALFGSLLLSPLSDHMIYLTEKERHWGKSKSKSALKGNHRNPRLVVNGSDVAMINEKALGEEKQKLLEKSSPPVEPLNGDNKDVCNGSGFMLKKETNLDTLAYEELVSNTLKLPLLPNSYHDVDLAKDSKMSVTHSKASVRSLVTNNTCSDVAAEEPSEQVVYLKNGKTEKSNRKGYPSGKVCKSRKPNYIDENSVNQKETDHKGEKSDFSITNQSHVSEEKKSLNTQIIDTSKQKVVQEAASNNDDGLKLVPGEVLLTSGGKRKSKGSLSFVDQGMDFQEDSSVISSSTLHMSMKNCNSNIIVSRSESETLKKGDGKVTDKYREFFGDLELEEEDDEIASEEMPLSERSKESELVQKRSVYECDSTFKEKPPGKVIEERSVSRDHPRLSSNVPSLTGKVPNPDSASAVVAPPVNEDWVCCDRCQTWRLLPLGTNPESLPEKWLCSMLDWLPGMNSCNVSEEETTNALRAHYQVQAPAASGSQHNRHDPSGGTLFGGPIGDAWGSTETSGLQVTASGGKKKYGMKDVLDATNQDNFIWVPNQKNLQESTKSRSLSEANHSSSIDEFGSQHVGQTSGSIVEGCDKENKKKTLVDHYSDEDDTMKLKMKNKRENDIDGLRPKKMKAQDVLLKDENCCSDHGIASSKGGRTSNSGLSNGATGKDPDNYSNSSKDSKGYPKKKLGVSTKNPEVQMPITPADGSLQVAKCENDDSVKKRKANGNLNSEFSGGTLPSTGLNPQGSRGFLEESLENDNRKEKKARISKSGGKDSNRGQDTIVTVKKAAIGAIDQGKRQDLGSTLSHRSIDAADSLRKDLGTVQPSAAATSSSSKVSSSRRSKSSHQEMKGSPVESVSSSPLKNFNTDKFGQDRRNVGAKDDFQDAGFFVSAGPRRSVDGDDIGGNDLSGKMKDERLKGKAERTASPHFAARLVDNNINPLDKVNQNACQTQVSDQSRDERQRDDNQYLSNGFHSKKSGTWPKEKARGSRSEFDNGKIMLADSHNESSNEEKMKAGRNKFWEKSGISSDRMEKSCVSKKDSAGKLTMENCKEGSPKIGGHEGPLARPDVISTQDTKQKILLESDNERSSKKAVPDKTGIAVSGRGKSHSPQPSVRGQSEATVSLRPIAESKIENGQHACGHDDILEASKQTKKSEKLNGNQLTSARNLALSTHKGRDIDAPSLSRRDSSSQAVTSAVREAKDLKHLADRLKNSGSTESTALYFQAALKFLHGASMLESCGSESTKHSEMIQSLQMYSSTAKLCEFCAHEYEKSKDMAAAALAYKCMEVAYMRVIYNSHISANRDRNELQTALKIIPPGESPSSSASDIDNLNNPVIADKAVVHKGIGSPQVTGNQVLMAKNRSSFLRLLNFAQDVNSAMEASRKSRTRLGEAQNREGLSSVRRALDFNFQDVHGLLQLVRVAMETINR